MASTVPGSFERGAVGRHDARAMRSRRAKSEMTAAVRTITLQRLRRPIGPQTDSAWRRELDVVRLRGKEAALLVAGGHRLELLE
jgi:hypothetical protein